MKFMVTWQIHPDKWHDILKVWCSMSPEERADTGPDVKLIGRWHNEAEMTGVAIIESDSAAAVTAYLLKWNHSMDMDVGIVLDDEESAAVGKQALGL
jgi:hypothetical protein